MTEEGKTDRLSKNEDGDAVKTDIVLLLSDSKIELEAFSLHNAWHKDPCIGVNEVHMSSTPKSDAR